MSIDFHELARRITRQEAGAEEVNIAQINEVVSITLRELATLPDDELQRLLSKARQKAEGEAGRVLASSPAPEPTGGADNENGGVA